MIYLICAKNSKGWISEINSEQDLQTNFYRYLLEITNHRNVMYPYELYSRYTKVIIPNRVNILFSTQSRKRVQQIVNAIVMDNKKEIVNTYASNVDDLYIYGTNKAIIETFAKFADFLIVYETEELGHSTQALVDSINFADYNILKRETLNKHNIEYFVKNKDNFLGN